MTPRSPYREGGTLARLIAPDRRRLHASLLIGLGLSLGVSLTLAAPRIAGALTNDGPVEPSERTFYVPIEVRDASNRPVVGAMITRGARVVGTTDIIGLAYARVRGVDGDQATVTVTCPSGHRSPQTIMFPLSPLSGMEPSADEGRPRREPYAVRCELDLHRVTVKIESDGGSDLPVLYLHREVARTDASGAATFWLDVPTDAQLSVTIDTSKRRDLHPANPTKVFVVGAKDETFVFGQRFASEP